MTVASKNDQRIWVGKMWQDVNVCYGKVPQVLVYTLTKVETENVFKQHDVADRSKLNFTIN